MLIGDCVDVLGKVRTVGSQARLAHPQDVEQDAVDCGEVERRIRDVRHSKSFDRIPGYHDSIQ